MNKTNRTQGPTDLPKLLLFLPCNLACAELICLGCLRCLKSGRLSYPAVGRLAAVQPGMASVFVPVRNHKAVDNLIPAWHWDNKYQLTGQRSRARN